MQLFESNSGALNINSQRGQKHFLPFFVDVRQDVPLAGLAVEGGERVVVPDVLSSEVFAGSATQKSMLDGGVCAVVTPLLNRSGQTMGVISTQFGEAYQPGVREVQLLDLLARQAVDFIERSRAEEMLRQNEEQMRVILDSALDAVVTIDRQGRVLSWNTQAEKIFGWTEAEAVGKTLTETIIPPQFREAHERGMRRYFETGFGPVLRRRMEMTALHRDGREFPVELAIAAVVVGDQVYFSAFIQDISERKRAEERLRLVVDAAPNAMIVGGEDGRIAMVNLQAEKLFGYARTELLGEPMEMLVPERFRARHSGMQHGFFAAPQEPSMGAAGQDLYGLRKDGSEVPIEIGLSPIQMAEGSLVLASIIDVSERKRTEERLRRFNSELESRVEKRTLELMETAAQLRNALHEREVLLQEVHHRVKNNLQVIVSLLSLQSGYIHDPKMLVHFQESQGRIRSMALIHEKLYGSESLARVDLADYVKSLVGMLVRTYATNDVNLDIRLDPAPVSIDTAIPVGLLLNELVTNVLKYAFPNGRKGCLLVDLEAKPNGQYAVRVEDDGVGLGPDFQFEQVNTLGLRLVQMLAKQLRAELTVRSESGHTEFDIRFQEPAAKSA